jgi:hypothetical protein
MRFPSLIGAYPNAALVFTGDPPLVLGPKSK